MNVGEFVRTKDGIIDNVRQILDKDTIEIYNQNDYYYSEFISKDEIIKSSPQIIDLVEKGDVLVDYNDNLYKAEKVYLDYVFTDKKNEYGQTITLVDYQIKYIMTNEQFENGAYKVGGDEE